MNTQWKVGAYLGWSYRRLAYAQTPQTLPTQPATPAPAPAPAAPATVSAGIKGSSLKIDGRLFLGVFATGDQGQYPNRTLAIPDAKLRFTFTPSKDITVVARININNATRTVSITSIST